MDMSNYPPGVTGREFQIAGYDDEEDSYRECMSAGTISVFTRDARDEITRIKGLLLRIATGDKPESFAAILAANLEYLLAHRIGHVDVERCPFAGEVSIGWYSGVGNWECPLCRREHREDAPEPDDNWNSDR